MGCNSLSFKKYIFRDCGGWGEAKGVVIEGILGYLNEKREKGFYKLVHWKYPLEAEKIAENQSERKVL